MLTRIYIDNFRCLVNFELKLNRINLLLGENGSGRSTVFEVLRRLQGFLGGDLSVDQAFPPEDLTRWNQRYEQRFELEAVIEDDVFVYAVSVAFAEKTRLPRLTHEVLTVNTAEPQYEFTEGEPTVFLRAPESETRYLFDSRRSGLAAVPRGWFGTEDITTFFESIEKCAIVGLCPPCMGCETEKEEKHLAFTGGNFASWYHYISQEQGNVFSLTEELRRVLPGFDSFSLRKSGERTKVLKVLFRSGKNPNTLAYNFDELSDGQRQLIALYSLLYGVKGEGYSLFLDEPDNYVALREIQPWLMSLQDACGDAISQVALVSHHPEVIDYLAGSGGWWFERPENGPTRLHDIRDKIPPTDGLKASETIARGWTT